METNVSSADYTDFRADRPDRTTVAPSNESQSSGVSWGAVIAGAFVAAAFYLILLSLGAGLGLSAISPWNIGASVSAVGSVAIAWLILIEIIASALGGYLTGRLRTKWTLVHSDEVYFRDTANGFLSWAVALVISVSLLASAAASMAGGIAQTPASSENTIAANMADSSAYFVDTMFRSDRAGAGAGDNEMQAQTEAARILDNALRNNQLPSADQNYLVQLIVAKTGITQAEAEQRVSSVVTNARQAADTARKATAHLLLWFFLSLLMGAFSASLAATIGGRQRDYIRSV
jgi:hypothetical protein